MKKITILILGLIVFVNFIFASVVPVETALLVAKNKYYEVTGIPQTQSQALEPIVIYGESAPALYIYNFAQGGFVIVAAEDNFYPIIAYSDRFQFVYSEKYQNVNYLINTYVKEIDYVRKNNLTLAKSDQWKKYAVDYVDFIPSKSVKGVNPLTGDILWDQGCGYNDYTPQCSGSACGHCWTGCVATAMGIIMKYWEFPIKGEGTHSYYLYPYGTLTAHFGETFYMWRYMDYYSPNKFVAKLLYHCGVSVNMNYGPDGSGAYSNDAINAFKTYFRYSQNAELLSKGNYTDADWINILKNELDQARPVYYSGRDDDNFGHAFVCDGYDDNDYFHFNFGWSGYNNGYYSLDDVGGFSNYQQAGINIYPDEDYYPYLPSVPSVTAILDTNRLDKFTVNISWDPANGAIAYELYRDDDSIYTFGDSVLFAIDTNAVPGDHFYGIRAIYPNGLSLTNYDVVDATFNLRFQIFDSTGTTVLRYGKIVFFGDTVEATFGSYTFYDVPFGWNYHYSVIHDDYPTYNSTIPIFYKDMNVNVLMGTSFVDEKNPIVLIYPNPTASQLFFSGLDNFKNPTIEIYNMNGKLMKRVYTFGNVNFIDISDFPMGIYNVVISDNKHKVNFRVIKK